MAAPKLPFVTVLWDLGKLLAFDQVDNGTERRFSVSSMHVSFALDQRVAFRQEIEQSMRLRWYGR